MKRTGKKTNDYVNCCWSKRQKYRFHCNAKGKRVFDFLLILFFEKYFAVVPIVFLHGNCIVTLMRKKNNSQSHYDICYVKFVVDNLF